jgi:hypothetical protein
MKKSEFETRLTVGIASYRLSLLRESGNRNLLYSSLMYEPDEDRKVYLLELEDENFILRSDLIFDDSTQRFFYVSKDRIEFGERNLKEAFSVRNIGEKKVYDILAGLKLRGVHTKNDFIMRIVQLIPQLEWLNNAIKDRKTGKTFISVKEDILYLEYKDGRSENYLNITKKDLNEKVLQQCVELITASLKYEGI